MDKSRRSKATGTTTGKPVRQLLQVRRGAVLHWPTQWGGMVRGEAGTVIPADDPALDMLPLQRHVLEAAHPSAEVTQAPVDESTVKARAGYRALGYDGVPFGSAVPAAEPSAPEPAVDHASEAGSTDAPDAEA